ncbi:SLC13 family permease [Thiohalomonas denitrificans]|uniref:Di-and tricarboxylate transporter n=1 Tax=Thiohalomonas denitrificans TaxID=415747 RepID=A0A1G5R0U7_9GAMM|nr:SLC13 family permease [Thiohalomonas denitrificans]SCZ66969.1 Di-and tricarboxylate transporter [Thiohalomonas denitrificans]
MKPSVTSSESSTVSESPLPVGKLVAAGIFALTGLWLASLVPTVEIAWVVAFLLLTIYLFAFEIVGVDVTAATVMVLLGLTSLAAPLMGLEKGLIDTSQLFQGFSSNAVISIIAVMIIGAGLDKTGLMSRVAGFILRVGGSSEKRVIPIVSSTAGVISSFMQNVGAAALFLPVVSRISVRTGLPMSRLLMPMGFCAILGGTLTMVGSSPLILLNDLMLTSNRALPPEHQMETWSLFSVTPVGLALIATGILYFIIAGRFVLPVTRTEGTKATNTMDYFRETYGIDYELWEVVVPTESPLVGKLLDDVESRFGIRVIGALHGSDDLRIGPGGLARDVGIQAGSVLGVLASPEHTRGFVEHFRLEVRNDLETFAELLSPSQAGIGEVVIPPGSSLLGKSARDVWLRKTYGLSMVALNRGGEVFREGDGIRDMSLQPGDILVVHTAWDALARLEKDRDFVVVTTEYPHEESRPHKVGWALGFFGVALGLILFSDLMLSVALLTGAIGMILSRVLSIEEAYEAVSWKTVFLLASLIPLGMAVETSGTAAWIAEQSLTVMGDMPIWVLQLAIAVLATGFTLVMSNVGATVLLVPLAVNIAIGVGANPAVFALTVAIATSNSFLIPTHQVNALIMGPGGYRVPDFMRAGGIMTVLFLIVMMVVMNLVY